MAFSIHERLKTDCIKVGEMKLCTLLLMNDSQYPWFILVPKREGVREVVELSRDDQISLQIESNLIAKMLLEVFQAEKLNIAALGNLVPQLHLHHIARFAHDNAWPKPVWGADAPVCYADDDLTQVLSQAKDYLGRNLKD